MACEDTAKLRTPLKSVCQTPDIGCVPITNGKPTCKPQPDEIPVAFDPSTTTLWLFSCKTRDWVAFQKFSMCQLSSINLDNIQNICDILQIGVSYNPGTGCKQGTISLRELGEKILECVQLQTKAVSVTANGDKLKIWVEGLEPLPPFYVKGRNLWSEGGTGTEADPLKIATHDPICQWPTKSQAQVDNANVKHIGACLDGQMSRVPFPPKVCELPEKSQAQVNAANNKQMIACVNGEGAKVPYPKMPCEFQQMTVEQVNAAEDKDMIVCVDGENAKVPIHDQLLTPICDNPQISVTQAKAKPKLRIVSCEDGKIMLFPLPPEMFQGHYMCVPFIDGIPSGPPIEGSGPIRFDCNDDIWFWVCEENRWHRIDVGNHYHPPWKQVYDYIANRCDNIKFHGWSEQDDCYTDFEMTPQELADFIFCECLDPITPVQANAAIGRGEEVKFPICVNGVSKKVDWSICSWPEIPSEDLLDLNEEDVKIGICADGENKIVKVSNIFNYYGGVEFYTAGTRATGDGGTGKRNLFLYETTSTKPFVVRGSTGEVLKGGAISKVGDNNPWGVPPQITLTNNTDRFKLYMIFQYVRLNRPKVFGKQCAIGVKSVITCGPYPWCEYMDKAYEYINAWRQSSSDLKPVMSCDPRNWTENLYSMPTGVHDFWNNSSIEDNLRFHAMATLMKGNYITVRTMRSNGDGRVSKQQVTGSHVNVLFLPPRSMSPYNSVTLTQESIITVSEVERAGIEVFMQGNCRFLVFGFNGATSINDIPSGQVPGTNDNDIDDEDDD